ncbi:ATP-dependent DNA ligase [Candidatus Pacearchaeota archaeon]|nr:ATP-dependent DNA ligase [Candidatus Pacearchaeota archaeon]
MRYSELCKVYEELGATTKRLEKIAILSEFLKKVRENDKEVLYLLLGNLYPSYDPREIGISTQTVIKALAKAAGISDEKIVSEWKKIGDLGQVAELLITKKKQSGLFHGELTTEKIISDLRELAKMQGKGTVGKKIDLIAGLLSNSKPVEAKYLVRILLADLRIGVQDSTLRDSIADTFFPDNKKIASEKVQHAYDLNPDIALIFEKARHGLKELDKVSLKPGSPIKAMLAQKVDSIEEGFEVVGKPAVFEYKYDGFRLMINKDEKGNISLFTRRLDNVTNQFPDVVSFIREFVNAKSFMIDSEAVGYDPKTKKYLPFQSVSQRIKRKYDIDKTAKDFPVELNVFDLLMLDGESYIGRPFIERTKALRKIIKNKEYKLVCAKQLITDSEKEAKLFFNKALKDNQEGLMVKNLNAVYKPGSRVGYMLKLKPEHRDLDLVIVGAEYGTGKRAGWLSSFILACKSDKHGGGEFLEVGRVGTGIKEKLDIGVSFLELTNLLKPLITKSSGKEVKVKPKIIVSVIFQEIQKSPTYNSGYALRFPRVTALRMDKPLNEINSLKDIEREYGEQK